MIVQKVKITEATGEFVSFLNRIAPLPYALRYRFRVTVSFPYPDRARVYMVGERSR